MLGGHGRTPGRADKHSGSCVTCQRPLADVYDSIEDINKSCLEEFRAHYECLDNNNQQLWQCRPAEWRLNKCVFHNLVRCAHHLSTNRWRSNPYSYLASLTSRTFTETREDHPRCRW